MHEENITLAVIMEAVDAYLEEKNYINRIKEFNKELKAYDYGIPDKNGKINNMAPKEFFKNYRLMSPMEFQKNKGGVCWDFCQYEDWYFKKNFPKCKPKFFYIIIDDNKNCPSHTFCTFKYNDKYYWFEASWRSHAGVHEYNSEKELLDDVTSKHHKFAPKYPLYIKEYNPAAMRAGMTVSEYMDTMSKGIRKYK